jgi:hypothetical protein
LEDAIRDAGGNERALLAIVNHDDVKKSAIELLRSAGIKSLSEAAATPLAVRGEGQVTGAPEALRTISELLSPRMNNLHKRLESLDISTVYLRDQWRNRIALIRGVRLAERVIATYKLCRKTHDVKVASGFDERSETLWLRQSKDSDGNFKKALFEALALRIFVDCGPRWPPFVLESAVQREARSMGLTQIIVPAVGEPNGAEAEESNGESGGLGEVFQMHRREVSDVSINLPCPSSLSPTTSGAQQNRKCEARDRLRTLPPSRYSPRLELDHRKQLKRDHYAWHCQVCLAARSPAELAPQGSYVEFQNNRHRIIVAHHVDQVHAGGARHGGNPRPLPSAS